MKLKSKLKETLVVLTFFLIVIPVAALFLIITIPICLILTPFDYLLFRLKKVNRYLNYKFILFQGLEFRVLAKLKDNDIVFYNRKNPHANPYVLVKGNGLPTIVNISSGWKYVKEIKRQDDKYILKIYEGNHCYSITSLSPFDLIEPDVKKIVSENNLPEYKLFYLGCGTKYHFDNKYLVSYHKIKRFVK
jgi:hypothetical protein